MLGFVVLDGAGAVGVAAVKLSLGIRSRKH